MTKTVRAQVTHHFAASAERVFDAWLRPEAVRHWMSLSAGGLPGFDVRRVEIDARIGGKFTFTDMRADGEARHWGTYLEIERPRRLVFTWFTSGEEEKENGSRVTVSIEPQGTGCIATLVHEMDAKWAEYIKQTEKGWNGLLEKVNRHLTEGFI